MSSLDFARSFVTFVTPGRGNNARIQVECRCEFSDADRRLTEELFLVASCKSEDTYAPRDLFLQPNYDFCGLFNEQQFAIIRTHADAAQDAPDAALVVGRFERVYRQIVTCPARLLETPAQVVEATLAGQPLVARTHLADPAGRFRCLLEYPVKTMNANDLQMIFQVDTGPVPFPSWEPDLELTVARLRLAYVAFNAPDFADFVLLAPTQLAPGVLTPHFSEVISVEARNEILALA